MNYARLNTILLCLIMMCFLAILWTLKDMRFAGTRSGLRFGCSTQPDDKAIVVLNEQPYVAVGAAGSIPANPQSIYTALSLLWRAESSCGKQMVGDGGRARGHFQHWQVAWDYGCKQLGVDWPYSDANNLSRAAAATAGCWSGQARQALEDGDVEMLTRQHRKPNDPYGKGQNEYLARVMKGNNNGH